MNYGPRYGEGVYSFFSLLFFWLIMASIGMALFNMLPFAFLDGGRFFFLTVLAITKSKKKTNLIYKIANLVIFFIFAVMILIWLFRWILGNMITKQRLNIKTNFSTITCLGPMVQWLKTPRSQRGNLSPISQSVHKNKFFR